MRVILDSGDKGCENKGMHFKIPRLIYSGARLHVVMLVILPVILLVLPVMAFASEPTDGGDRALFWSIEKQGEKLGYLLGTIHSEDPRVLDFSEALLAHLQSSEVFAMELVPDIPTLARLSEYMHYPEGQSLEQVIGKERFNALSSALSGYQVPSAFIRSMKPWAAMMTLSTPPPMTGFFMDLSLSLRASGSGLKVIGLETLEQQLSFLEDMPLEMQILLLDQAIAEFDQVEQVHDDMVRSYLSGDLQQIYELSLEQLKQAGETASDYFLQRGIDDRNQRMLNSLLEHMPDKRVFAAVGALHLPGENGLLMLLRQQGYNLSPLDSIVAAVETDMVR
jgi:uncharacterized protein YbaP (TraB family)